MVDVISLQDKEPEVPGEEKLSHVSYFACHNSYVSQTFCWH